MPAGADAMLDGAAVPLAPTHEAAGAGPFATCAFIVNTTMGMGFLAIPYTASRVGAIPALILTIVVCGVSCLTGVWMAAILSLASALRAEEAKPILARSFCPSVIHTQTELRQGGLFQISGRVMSYTELIRTLLGPWAEGLGAAALCFSLICALWAYAALVAGSLASMVPLPLSEGTCDVYQRGLDGGCAYQYYGYLLLFAAVAMTLSVLSLQEQRGFQIAMTIMRLLLVSIMLCDCLRMLAEEEAPPTPAGHHGHTARIGEGGPSYDPEHFPERPPSLAFRLAGVPRHVATVTAAIAVHVVIPEATHELADKPRHLIGTICAALTFCGAVYAALGLAVPTVFGEWVHPVCTLNWANFTFGEHRASRLAVFLRSFLILAPVVDVTAAYPILAMSLASNLNCVLSRLASEQPPKDSEDVGTLWWQRAACAVVPLLGSALMFDISVALSWTGLFIAPFMFIFPPVLLLRARRLLEAQGVGDLVEGSPYFRFYCRGPFLWTTLVFGSVLYAVGAVATVAGIAS